MAQKKSRFMQWYESYSGKHTINIIYSAGASIVIVGALFKIMHWPGAGIVLTAGMCTEAFLFLIGVLEKPHEEFHWANVFPQLLEYGAPEDRLAKAEGQARPTLLGAGAEAGAVKEEKKSVPALTDKDMDALKESINGLAKTASQLSELGKIAEQTNALSEKMAAAGNAAGEFAASATKLGVKSNEIEEKFTTVIKDMDGVVTGTKECTKNVGVMGQKLSALNSVYELQLSAVQAHAEAVKGQTDAFKAQTERVNAVAEKVSEMEKSIDKMQTVATETIKSQEIYGANAKKLADQVAELNKIYGNMLTALS